MTLQRHRIGSVKDSRRLASVSRSAALSAAFGMIALLTASTAAVSQQQPA
jgi:hypothetical protein